MYNFSPSVLGSGLWLNGSGIGLQGQKQTISIGPVRLGSPGSIICKPSRPALFGNFNFVNQQIGWALTVCPDFPSFIRTDVALIATHDGNIERRIAFALCKRMRAVTELHTYGQALRQFWADQLLINVTGL